MGRKPKSAKTEAKIPNMHGDSNLSEGAVNTEQKPHLLSTTKAAKNMNVSVRRSGRLQNLSSPTQIQAKDIVADPITLVESENEDGLHSEQSDSEPASVGGDLEGKIDYLVQTVNELKSKVTEGAFPGDTQYTELNYKSMYIESQKKIEALREENHQLVKKLEFALGKIEVYEKMKDVIANLKDTFLYTSLGKTTEAVLNLSSQTPIGKSCSLDATTPDVPGIAAEPKGLVTENAIEPRAARGKRKKH